MAAFDRRRAAALAKVEAHRIEKVEAFPWRVCRGGMTHVRPCACFPTRREASNVLPAGKPGKPALTCHFSLPCLPNDSREDIENPTQTAANQRLDAPSEDLLD